MAQTNYTFSIQNDFPNHKLNSDKLTTQLHATNIVPLLVGIGTSGDVCTITYLDALSSGEQSTLNGVIAIHDGEAIPETENKDVKGNPVVATSVYGYVAESTKWKGYRYVAPHGATTIFDEAITKQIYMQGGRAVIKGATDGDIAEFSIVDKDDVLGLFAGYGLTVGQDVLELDKYVQNYFPDEDGDSVEHKVQTVAKVLQGLYLRLTYHSTGSSDVVIKITYLGYEGV